MSVKLQFSRVTCERVSLIFERTLSHPTSPNLLGFRIIWFLEMKSATEPKIGYGNFFESSEIPIEY